MDFQYPDEYHFMEGIDAFPAYIYKTKFNFNFKSFQDKVDEYLKASKEFSTKTGWSDPENGDAITGVHLNNTQEYHGIKSDWDIPHNWEEFETFFKFVEYVTPFLMKTWYGAPTTNMSVSDSWINVHRKGGWTEAHHHQNACIAIAGYLEVPKDSGNLLIENPLRPYKCSEPIGKDYSYWGPIEVETNDVLFFPGWLTHKTESNSTDNPRYVLSTNVSVLTNWPGIPSWHYEGRKINTTD